MRGTGLTKAMVEAIPAEGGTIIVHSSQMRRYVEAMIHDLRGSNIRKLCKVVVVEHASDLYQLGGLRGYVDFDHAVGEHVHPIVFAGLRRAVRHISERTPTDEMPRGNVEALTRGVSNL